MLLYICRRTRSSARGNYTNTDTHSVLTPYIAHIAVNSTNVLFPNSFYAFRKVAHFRVLICGGDGTIGWVLQHLECVEPTLCCRKPLVVTVPMGTGNDTARALGFGSTFVDKSVDKLLATVDRATPLAMDRWNVRFEDSTTDVKTLSNYFGIGIDAKLVLAFHQAREMNPERFTNRWVCF